MSVTFVQQNNAHTFDIVFQENTGDKKLNPVTVSASLVWRIRKTPGANYDTTIFCYDEDNHKLRNTNQCQVLDYLRGTASALGEERLGLSTLEIGNKSVQSVSCMAWFLSNHPIKHMKMIG